MSHQRITHENSEERQAALLEPLRTSMTERDFEALVVLISSPGLLAGILAAYEEKKDDLEQLRRAFLPDQRGHP